jgi:hypothetical protein
MTVMTETEKFHRFVEQDRLVEKYLLGELDGADLENFDRHIFECCICFEEVKTGEAFKQHLARGVSATRVSWWQRMKDFLSRAGKGNALLLFLVFGGPGPVPPLPADAGFISLETALISLAFVSGMALGAWTIVWIGRRQIRHSISVMAEIKEASWRHGYGRGYAAALGIQAEIDAPRERKER